jgi:hypothetical protein
MVALVTLLAMPWSAAAQAPPLDVLIPRAAAIGDDWQLLDAADLDPVRWAAFRRYATAAYVGPHGARTRVELIHVGEGEGTKLAAWTAANRMFDEIRVQFSARANDAVAPPGCAKGRHAAGADAMIPALPVGLVLCAADPDVIVLVYVSGPVGSRIGAEAADHVLELVLRRGTTPLSLAP